MRLFVAIELGDAARAAITDEQRRLQAAIDVGSRFALKWVAPARMHLTLAFLGEVANGRVEDVVEAMRQPIDVEPFSMVFGGLGVFPAVGAPRVVWLGVTCGAAAAGDVQRRVAERIRGLGLVRDARTFHPHLTLARWRESRSSDRQRVVDAGRQSAIARVDVDAVALIHSRLSPAGPAYTALCRGPLRGSALPPLQSA
jgi:2'-5' RNA ligase